MKYLFLFLILLFAKQLISQEEAVNPWHHSVRLMAYTTTVIRYGGNELRYQLSYQLNDKTILTGGVGFFYHVAKSERNLPDLHYRYFPIFGGIQRSISKNNKLFLELNVGASVLNYNESPVIDGNYYWARFEDASDYGSDAYRRNLFIQQLSLGYRFGHFSANIGENMYFTRYAHAANKSAFDFNLGVSLGVGYTF